MRSPHLLLVPAALLALTLVPASCSSKPGVTTTSSGADLYGAHCAQCHGAEGRGTFLNLGPSFEGVKQHWTADKLLEYIADPKAYAAKEERLGKREMAAIADTVTAEQRKKLVEHALTLMN